MMEVVKSFEYGTAIKITITSSTGWDRLHADTIWDKLNEALGEPTHWREQAYRRQFSRACTQTASVVGIEWNCVSKNSSLDEIKASYEAWMSQPGELLEKWTETIGEADAPPGPRDLQPPEMLSESELKDPK